MEEGDRQEQTVCPEKYGTYVAVAGAVKTITSNECVTEITDFLDFSPKRACGWRRHKN